MESEIGGEMWRGFSDVGEGVWTYGIRASWPKWWAMWSRSN